MTEKYRDRHGIAFDDYRNHLPDKASDFPRIPRVKKDVDGLQGIFHSEFRGTTCWWCGIADHRVVYPIKMELHHLFAGSVGKSHERELFTYLCHYCHENHVAKDDLGRLLFLKWKHDPEWVDWKLMAIRYHQFLPDLITD